MKYNEQNTSLKAGDVAVVKVFEGDQFTLHFLRHEAGGNRLFWNDDDDKLHICDSVELARILDIIGQVLGLRFKLTHLDHNPVEKEVWDDDLRSRFEKTRLRIYRLVEL